MGIGAQLSETDTAQMVEKKALQTPLSLGKRWERRRKPVDENDSGCAAQRSAKLHSASFAGYFRVRKRSTSAGKTFFLSDY
ncbi:hypothetical protein AV530_004607 [Patagioenas fasciata monilis]|uniref:Uncharacterized protein n=1 Tax=Patagioenas fasciata monilis TaxID=372326 RepID=A0A1V4KHT9_PATFA|nr:hypothetical protein AV530_004607 [Patagioenas fasciata monilis]